MISGVYLTFLLAFIFCLAIWLSSMTLKSFQGVFLWIMILVSIFVYIGLLDLWILILLIIINIVFIGIQVKNKEGI